MFLFFFCLVRKQVLHHLLVLGCSILTLWVLSNWNNLSGADKLCAFGGLSDLQLLDPFELDCHFLLFYCNTIFPNSMIFS